MTGSHTRCNPSTGSKDELVSGAPIDNSGTPKPTPTVFYPLTLAPASASDPPGRYTNKDLQKATKLALKLFVKGQEHGQLWANFTSRK